MGPPWAPRGTRPPTRLPGPAPVRSPICASLALGSGLAEEEPSRIALEVVGQQAHRSGGRRDLLETSIELVDRGRVVDGRLGLLDRIAELLEGGSRLGGRQLDVSGYSRDVAVECGR